MAEEKPAALGYFRRSTATASGLITVGRILFAIGAAMLLYGLGDCLEKKSPDGPLWLAFGGVVLSFFVPLRAREPEEE